MTGDNFEVEKYCGTIRTITNRNKDVTEVRLTKTSWYGKPAKWDLRNWTNELACGGVVIGDDEALKRLRDLLIEVCSQLK